MYKEKCVKIQNSSELREILIKIHYFWKTNTHTDRHAHTRCDLLSFSYICYHFYLGRICPQVSDQFFRSAPIIGDSTIPPPFAEN